MPTRGWEDQKLIPGQKIVGLWFAALGLASLRLEARVVDPAKYEGKYVKALSQKIEPAIGDIDRLPVEELVNRVHEFLANPSRSVEEKYLSHRLLALVYWLNSEEQKAFEICEKSKINADDYRFLQLCIDSNPAYSKNEKIRLVEELFERSIHDSERGIAPMDLARRLLWYFSQTNDVAQARAIFKKTLDALPPDAPASTLSLKASLAQIYALPTNSPKTLAESIRLYDEVEEMIKNDPDETDWHQTIAYNKGIVKIMSLEDYQGALLEFNKVDQKHRNFLDIKIFRALSLAHLGRMSEAKESISDINFDAYANDQTRIPFLRCYLDLVRYMIKETTHISACAYLSIDTQADVLTHVTREISKLSIDPKSELLIWRQYYNFYEHKLSPQMREIMEKQVDAIELERAKSDSRMKDLELRNFNLLKMVFGILAVTMILVVGLFVRLKARNDNIEKLQAYIHKSVLSRFLPPLMVEEIIQGNSRIESEPHEQNITVLFCDMVGFTALAGQLGAQVSATILNRFMQKMSEVIYQNGGTIDKFIGDSVMAIFGAPVALLEQDQAKQAVHCAREMMRAMDEINQDPVKGLNIRVEVRIGVHQGPAIVGIFGSERRADYTAIGPTVNLASRIEGAAPPHHILISTEVARHLTDEVTLDHGFHKLKGIDQVVKLYAVKTDEAIPHPKPLARAE